MKVSKVLDDIIKSIFRRVSMFERRAWLMDDKDLTELYMHLDTYNDPFVRRVAGRLVIGMLYHYLDDNAKETILKEIRTVLPFMLGWLKIHYVAGEDNKAAGEKRRKLYERAWRDGADVPPEFPEKE